MEKPPKIYEGLRHPDEPNTAGETMVFVNGQPLSKEPSLKIRNHSPDGFSWGYGGSGPAQLALAILLDYFDGDAGQAQHYYQDFKFAKVAAWPADQGWKITGEEIAEWIFEGNTPPYRPVLGEKEVLVVVPGARPGKRIGLVRYNDSGYYETAYDHPSYSEEQAAQEVRRVNAELGLPEKVIDSMESASMFGWHTKAAQPAHDWFKEERDGSV
jgi:hypothetical protein